MNVDWVSAWIAVIEDDNDDEEEEQDDDSELSLYSSS